MLTKNLLVSSVTAAALFTCLPAFGQAPAEGADAGQAAPEAAPEAAPAAPEPTPVVTRTVHRSSEKAMRYEIFEGRSPLSLIGEDGNALPIIVPEDAAPFTRKSAHYLADVIETIGGVRPKVYEELPDPVPAQAVWVGYQPAMDDLFPGVSFEFKHREEVIMAGNESHIAITGRDNWDPKYPTVKGRRFPIEDKQQEYGTANAVFSFLQDRVGVRWLYPGETGTDYPSAESLNITPFKVRYHPQFLSRIGMFTQLERGYEQVSDSQDWVMHQRLLLDSMLFQGGHYFKHWWGKYGEEHPELFALQPDGTRGTHPEDPQRRKLCEGEPLVGEFWLKEAEEMLAAYPYHDLLYTMPNDSYFDGHCIDPRSRAMDVDPSLTEERVKLTWAGGVSEQWVPLSDRYVNFANKLSDLAVEKFPDKEFLVMMNAYGEVGNMAPVTARPRDNILVVSVHNFFLRHKAMREREKQLMKDWAAMTKQIFWRPNLGNQGGIQTGFPDVPFQQAMEDIRFVAEMGVIGVFFDTLFEHWGNNAPFFYLVSQMTWDPYADGNAILEDYYQRCYGPAAAPMKEYWELMEKTRMDMVETVAMPRVALLRSPLFFTPEVFAKADDLFNQAREAVAGADEKYAKRLDFTAAGLAHTKSFVKMRELMALAEENPSDKEALHARAAEELAAWKEMSAKFPPFVVNTKRLSDPRRIQGFHPDAPISRRALREMQAGPDKSGLNLD